MIALFTSSCIELEEKLIIRSDKSGKLIYSLSIEQTGGLLGLFSQFVNQPLEGQIKDEALKWVNQLQKQQGISDVQFNLDTEQADVYLSFEFENDYYLNNALYAISGNKKAWFSPAYLKIKKHRMKKFNIAPYVKQYMKRESFEIDPSFSSYISYVSTIQAPGTIKKVRADKFSLNADKTTFSQQFEITDVIDNLVKTGVVLRYK